MKFAETAIAGVLVIDAERFEDERGFFARSFCAAEFAARGLDTRVSQCSVSYNRRRATLRGMHFQTAPYAENKLVRCTAGAIYDVALDLRPASPTFLRWAAVELTATNRQALYIPQGCAHGFQALAADSELLYQISVPYHPGSSRGVRWNDPALAIDWPLPDPIVSDRDRWLPLWADVAGASTHKTQENI